MPAPSRPPGFDRELKRLVGLSPNGTDLYLRFIWGMDVTEVLDGMTVHRYPDPLGKYVGVDRWVLEGWQSPDVYDRTEWNLNRELMGPWPENGVWDYIATLQDEQGGYLPLDASKAMKMVREWRQWKSKTKKRTLEDLLKSRCVLQVAKETAAAAKKKTVMADFVDRFTRASELGAHAPRKSTVVATIDEKGVYRRTEAGLLVPKTI